MRPNPDDGKARPEITGLLHGGWSSGERFVIRCLIAFVVAVGLGAALPGAVAANDNSNGLINFVCALWAVAFVFSGIVFAVLSCLAANRDGVFDKP